MAIMILWNGRGDKTHDLFVTHVFHTLFNKQIMSYGRAIENKGDQSVQ